MATEYELFQIVEFVRKLDHGHTRFERFRAWIKKYWNYHVYSLDECGRIILDKAKIWQLIREHKRCEALWGKYSSDSFAYYIKAIRNRIDEIRKEKELTKWFKRYLRSKNR